MADVTLTDIRKSFGPVEVLHGVSLAIAEGEFVSLLGASGCGKTTLLRTVAGLEAPTSGRVMIGGEDVTELPPERRDIAMMFQSYALLPHLSVAENVRFPLRMRRIGAREDQHERVREALETVHLGQMAERKPNQLSGGQQQRVALARAIVSKPQVLLLDEPLSNLDARLREDMQVELIEIHKRLGLTTLFVTHDQEEALSLSDRIVLINKGRIEQEGAPARIRRRDSHRVSWGPRTCCRPPSPTMRTARWRRSQTANGWRLARPRYRGAPPPSPCARKTSPSSRPTMRMPSGDRCAPAFIWARATATWCASATRRSACLPPTTCRSTAVTRWGWRSIPRGSA